jgi:hypothetical protein
MGTGDSEDAPGTERSRGNARERPMNSRHAEPDTLADPTRTECGRRPASAGRFGSLISAGSLFTAQCATSVNSAAARLVAVNDQLRNGVKLTATWTRSSSARRSVSAIRTSPGRTTTALGPGCRRQRESGGRTQSSARREGLTVSALLSRG